MTGLLSSFAIGTLSTQVGRLSFAATDVGLVALCWGSPEELARELDGRSAQAGLGGDAGTAEDIAALAYRELLEYFSGGRRRFEVPMDWRLAKTKNQRAVLGALYETVGFGESITYGELAARSGTGIPARGIGAIMAGNPVPIVVACHRVVAAGGLGGFSGGDRPAHADEGRPGSSPYGLETKRWLLKFEGVLPPTLGWDPAARLDLDSPLSLDERLELDGPLRRAARLDLDEHRPESG